MSDHPSPVDPDDIGFNDSGNPSFGTVLKGFLSRRHMLQGMGTSAALLMAAGASLGALIGAVTMTRKTLIRPHLRRLPRLWH